MQRNCWEGYDGVEVIEGKVGGVPLIKRSRVPADLVAECLDAGETVDEIAYNYDLKPVDILHLKEFRDSHKLVLQP
jgi:uncharacterized protein (DUF433 family)